MFAIGIPDYEEDTLWWDFEKNCFRPELMASCLLPSKTIVDLVMKEKLREMVDYLVEVEGEDPVIIRNSINVHEVSDIIFDDNHVERFDEIYVGGVILSTKTE